MKKLIYLMIALVLPLGVALPMATPVLADATGFKFPAQYATGTTGNLVESPEKAFVDDVPIGEFDSVGGKIAYFRQQGDCSEIYYGFGFGIPPGATINGIEVVVSGYTDMHADIPLTFSIKLSGNTGTSWTDYKETSTLAQLQDAEYTLGGSADLWNQTWNAGSYSDANFRLEVAQFGFGKGDWVALDSVRVKVYYTMNSTIVVTSPNGGENWDVFSAQTITWSSSGVSGLVKIELSRDGGSTWQTIIPVAPNDGKQKWLVLAAPTNQAKIKISSISNPASFDISDANFAIVGPSIKVTSPNGGGSWKIGSTQTISWDSMSVLLVRIELSRNSGASWTTIAAYSTNHGIKTWKVTGPATTHARVRIVSLSNSAADASDADFTITSN